MSQELLSSPFTDQETGIEGGCVPAGTAIG